MDVQGLKDTLVWHIRAHTVLSKRDSVTASKLTEVAKACLREKAKHLVTAAKGHALLYSYGSDGTPVLTKKTFVSHLSSGRSLVRKGGQGVEFLIEKAFLKSFSSVGEPMVCCLTRDPRPLAKGKGAWQCFQAAVDFFPMVRTMGHKGIIVNHYGFDRALYSSLQRKMQQRHKLFYQIQSETDEAAAALGALTEWVVTTPCANHDCQNSLRWGLMSLGPNEEVLKRLWVVIESQRNGFSLLVGHLESFITEALSFVDEEFEEEVVVAFWHGLGVEPEIAEFLAMYNVHWQDGALKVNLSANNPEADLVGKLYTAMLSTFQTKKFTDSRWLTIGDSCRTLVASWALGLEGSLPKPGLMQAPPTSTCMGAAS